jgi:cysteine sulfinate desulfinase/cysteine desulfurase-like protein
MSNEETMMSTAINAIEEARARIARLQRSPKYRTFFNAEAIEAFKAVEGTVFAGQPLDARMSDDPPAAPRP